MCTFRIVAERASNNLGSFYKFSQVLFATEYLAVHSSIADWSHQHCVLLLPVHHWEEGFCSQYVFQSRRSPSPVADMKFRGEYFGSWIVASCDVKEIIHVTEATCLEEFEAECQCFHRFIGDVENANIWSVLLFLE